MNQVRLALTITTMFIGMAGYSLARDSPPCYQAPPGAPCTTSALNAIVSQTVDYSNAAQRLLGSIKQLEDALAKCGHCANRSEIEASLNQLKKEDEARRSMEGELLRMLGINGVKDFGSLHDWFAEHLKEKPDTESVYVPAEAATMSVFNFCRSLDYPELSDHTEVVYHDAGTTVRRPNTKEEVEGCMRKLDPAKVVQNRTAAMTYCFNEHDFLLFGARENYNACMNQNDILTAFCTHSVWDHAGSKTNETCPGPDPSGREVMILRNGGAYRADVPHQVQIFQVTLMTDLNRLQTNAPRSVEGAVLFPLMDSRGEKTLVPRGAKAVLTAIRKAHEHDPSVSFAVITGDYAIVEGKRFPLPTRKTIIRLPTCNPNVLDLWYDTGAQNSGSAPGLPAYLQAEMKAIGAVKFSAPALSQDTVANTQSASSSQTPLPLPAFTPSRGAQLTVSTIDPIDAAGVNAGRRFRATLETPLQSGGQIILARGAQVLLKGRNLGSGGVPNLVHLAISVDYALATDGNHVALNTNEFGHTVITAGSLGARLPVHIQVWRHGHRETCSKHRCQRHSWDHTAADANHVHGLRAALVVQSHI